MNTISNITFLYPYVFLLLFVYIFLIYRFKQKNQSLYFSNMKMLLDVSSKQNVVMKIIHFLIVFFILCALATPVEKKINTISSSKGYEISLIVDVSGGMVEDDKFNTTKKIVKDFINKRENDRLSLSVFANFAYVAVPLTYDKKSLLDILKFIEVGVAGYRDTALYEALYLGSDIFKNSSSKNKVVILLTDGLNTVKTVSLNTAIDKVKKHGIKVYTIGIGSQVNRNNDLQKIASKTNAKSYNAKNASMLQEIYEDINKLESSAIETTSYNTYKHYFFYPLYLALLFLFIMLYDYRNKL